MILPSKLFYQQLNASGSPLQSRLMRKAVLSGVVAVTIWSALPVVSLAQSQAQSQTFQYNGPGQWSPLATAPTTRGAPDPTLDRVDDLLQHNQNESARDLAIHWVLDHRTSPQVDRGLYLIAQALYQYGDRIKAFYYLDELMDEHPDSPFFNKALELQYRIADAYLDGYKRRFLGMPTFTAYDEAVEMLYRIQQRSPGSEIAERALLRTANFYYANRDYDFAGDTFAAFMRSYPRSPSIPQVKLHYAYALYAQFRGPRFDATPVLDARQQLVEIAAQYPELAQQENVAALISQLDRNLARKLYVVGDFYTRTHEPVGAAYTFKYLAQAYPQTPEAKQAQKDLATLPKSAVNAAPEPAITPGYAPPTQEKPSNAPQPDDVRPIKPILPGMQ